MSHSVLKLGDFPLERGGSLREAVLAYCTWGELDRARGNAILLPSFITGTHEGYAAFVGAGRCFDPARYFIIGTNLFGNGLSTSPSNAAPGQRGPDFPNVTIRDNVRAQQQLVTDVLGIDRLALAAGYSMGAQQAYQWAVMYPERVARLAVWCGHARTTPHTAAFLDGLRAVLEVSSDWEGGRYDAPPLKGLRALARVYAPWGLSQEWYRRKGWRGLGFEDPDSFAAGFWQPTMERIEPSDFLAQVATWRAHDVGLTAGCDGDLAKALRRITAHTIVMPCATDLYFPVADAAAEASQIAGAQLQVVNSDWGHFAGLGFDPASTAQIDTAIQQVLSIE